MNYGKSIRLYLSDGHSAGIRHAEIVNWTGQAIAAPRTRFVELKEWPEVSRPGVYFLIGLSDESQEGRTYIGESENVYRRLADHVRDEDFWRDCVVFSSKDENLTKGHVKYLESRLIEIAEEANRFNVKNKDHPPRAPLPRSDVDAMEEFIDNVRISLGALGYPILETLKTAVAEATSRKIDATSTRGREFFFSGITFEARGTETDEGFVVYAGSRISKNAATSAPDRVKQLRDAAIKDGRLTSETDNLVLNTDHLFSAPSAAASFVAGSSRNGREAWVDEEGRSIKQIEESSAARVKDEAPNGKLPIVPGHPE